MLPFAQFPWRFLSIQALFGALGASGWAFVPFRRLVSAAILVVIVIAGLGDLQPDYLALSDADVTAERLAGYEWFTGNIGTTVSAEYLPPEVTSRPFTSTWLKTGNRDDIRMLDSYVYRRELVHRGATDQQWIVATQAPTATITLPTLYWPGWGATLNGQPVKIRPSPGTGLVTLELPGGEHWLDLRLGRTPIRLAAEIITIAGVLLLGWLLWPGFDRSHLRRWAPVVLFLVILAAVLRLWPAKHMEPSAESWDFGQVSYLHNAPDGIPFEGGARLRAYHFSADVVSAGDRLVIDLNWRSLPEQEVSMALTTPAVQRTKLAPIIKGERQGDGGNSGEMTFVFGIPANTPHGLFLPRLTVEGTKALTSSGNSRDHIFLRPVRVIDLPAASGRNAPLLGVRGLAAGVVEGGSLSVQLQWNTRQQLSRNYNFSLRITDSQGIELGQADGQTGYGYQPSSLWIPGELMDDWLGLETPESVRNGQVAGPYGLVARLYDPADGREALLHRLGELVWMENRLQFRETQRNFTLPTDIVPVEATFGQRIQLDGYRLEVGAESLELTLLWEALRHEHKDFYHFVHLLDPVSGEILAQHDSMPQNNSYPTSQWITGEIVADWLRLGLSDLAPGRYWLQVGLYAVEGDSVLRLPATDGAGHVLPDDAVRLEQPITINR